MVRVTVLDDDTHVLKGVTNNKSKGEKMVVEPSMNSTQRRKLADISNLQNQKKPMNLGATVVSSKDYVERLQKENMTLMKVVMERNKIIELSGGELQKLRISLQKVQEQNLQLAQANTHMLAEINTNKDRLKALQHELGCKNGLLMAKRIQLEEQTLPSTYHASEDKAHANAPGGPCASFQTNGMDHKNDKRKQQSRIKSSESSSARSVQINEKANKKRRVSGRRNTANSDVTDVTGRPAESSPTEDNIDNKKLVSDGDNADKKKLVPDAGNRINDIVHSKSAGIELRETRQTENLHEVTDAKETKETARFSLRKRSSRLTSQEPEPSESFHESFENIETTKRRRVSSRRQSARFDFQELEVTENLNGLHDDQETAGIAGCSASTQSIETRPEAVKADEYIHETKETTKKNRVSLRRQSTKSKPQRAESADKAIKDKSSNPSVNESHQIPSSTSMELEKESEKKVEGNESEVMRRTSVGRPLRQAAGKIQSYKEISLKEKMRRE